MIPGEYRLGAGNIEINQGREPLSIIVINKGDRAIQIGSHFHFFEVNKALEFDRIKCFGMRLCIPSGTAVRFEPGEEKPVNLVMLGGSKSVYGLNGLCSGPVDPIPSPEILQKRLHSWKGEKNDG